METYCPATGKKLRLKDLITVNFTRVPEGEAGWAMDPVTKDTFSNASRLALIKPTGELLSLSLLLTIPLGTCQARREDWEMCLMWQSRCAGDVVLWETYEKYIKPEGEYEGTKLSEGDVLELQKGGTGFAKHDGDATQSSKYFALGPGSGRADLRGQHRGAVSKGGLVFNN